MTDLYPSEEGHISDGLVIGFAKIYAGSADVELHEAVNIGTTAVSGWVSVGAAAADGDAIGIAMKAGSAGDVIPVCFYGVVKLVAGTAITAGQVLRNDALGTYILDLADLSTGNVESIFVGDNGTGTAFRLGMALQPGAASGDEFLCLVGGFR